jgi:cytosine permease
VAGVALAKLMPGIPPINGILGSAIIYVILSSLIKQSKQTMPTTEEDNMSNIS